MNNDICEGCGLEDCSPTYNSYADLALCDFCYESAEDEKADNGYDDYPEDDYYLEDDYLENGDY